jgi:hypothetical protein
MDRLARDNLCRANNTMADGRCALSSGRNDSVEILFNHGWTQMDTDVETIDPTEAHLTNKCAFATGWESRFAHHYPCESVSIRGFNRIVPA